MKSLISIIIPVYNQANELRQALASVLGQTWQEYEVIIVNDGSTDTTAMTLEEFKSKFESRGIRCVLIFQSNQGSNFARNRGLQEARGEFVIFWDADVVAHPQMLQKMLAALQEHPESCYAYSAHVYGKKKFKLHPFDAEKLKKMPYIHTTSLVRRKDFPGWDEHIKRLQDWDVWLTMLEQGKVGIFIPEQLFTVRTGSGTMSHWLPSFAYRLPWLKQVKRYNEAAAIIKKKHSLQ